MTVTATTATASEAGSAAGRFTFTRTGNTSASLTVRYTVDGTATADTDYAALPETVTIPAGSLAAALEVIRSTTRSRRGARASWSLWMPTSRTPSARPPGASSRLPAMMRRRDLVVSTLTPPAVGGAGATMTVSDVTRNQGAGVAEPSATGLYLSTSGSLTAVPCSSARVPCRRWPPRAGHRIHDRHHPGRNRDGPVLRDCQGGRECVVLETQEGNNTRSALVRIGPDLVVSALAAPANAAAGSAIAVSDTTSNNGGGSAGTSVTRFYLSTNVTWDAGDVLLGSRTVGPLAAAASSAASSSLTIPANTTGGAYYIIARADANADVAETFESNNNRQSGQIAIGPDLTVSALAAPSTAGAGALITVSDTTGNQGAGPAAASQTSFYLSTNTLFDAADVLLGSRAVSPLGAGAVSSASTIVTIPAGTMSGTYYVVARADAAGVVPEGNESNNTRAASVRIGADLTIAAVTAPATGAAGSPIAISDTTTNTGGGVAAASVTKFYLSANAVLDAGDTALGARAVSALSGGASSTASSLVTIPAAMTGGAYYIIGQADADATVAETSEGNNIRVGGLVRIGADLVVSVATPPPVGAGGSVLVTDTTKNQGSAAADGTSTAFYLSANAVLDGADVLLGTRLVPLSIRMRHTRRRRRCRSQPPPRPAPITCLRVADAGGRIAEGNEANNTAAAIMRVGPDLMVIGALGAVDRSVGNRDHRHRYGQEPGRRRRGRIGDDVLPVHQRVVRHE